MFDQDQGICASWSWSALQTKPYFNPWTLKLDWNSTKTLQNIYNVQMNIIFKRFNFWLIKIHFAFQKLQFCHFKPLQLSQELSYKANNKNTQHATRKKPSNLQASQSHFWVWFEPRGKQTSAKVVFFSHRKKNTSSRSNQNGKRQQEWPKNVPKMMWKLRVTCEIRFQRLKN